MAFSLSKSQEDEFALLLMGAPSPYEQFAFPGSSRFAELTDYDRLSAAKRRAFDHACKKFVALMGRDPTKRLTLKSPAHMARLAHLAELFPGLKVVHIVRDPRAVLASSFRALHSMESLFALGRRETPARASQVLSTYLWCFDKLEEGRRRLSTGQFAEITYEALLADPLATLESLYQQLALGDFAPVRDTLQAELPRLRAHQSQGLALTPMQQAALEQHVGPILQRYGYR